MLRGTIYINGIACISAQATLEQGIDVWFEKNESEPFKCIEPDYKTYFSPIALRRLSRILKFSVLTAQKCLQDAGLDMPDAIITGTGLGCLEDSEKFLRAVIENQEENLSPTAFIFSTHNTISGQIAMTLKCNRANNTFSNRYFSFESALLESIFMLKDGDARNILVGSADEMIPMIREVSQSMGLWVKPSKRTTISGEGACFAVISETMTEQSYAAITAFKLVFKLSAGETIEDLIFSFLQEAQLNIADIDVLISGESEEEPEAYTAVYQMLPHTSIVIYKHLIGEYFTASSFAYFLGAHILKSGSIPPHYLKNNREASSRPQKILIYNQYKGEYHSLALLTSV
jgi:3-oxoacyl-[acyl-carrier-protein] synthase II